MLQKETEVLSVSEEYKNRNSKFKRIYVELDKKELQEKGTLWDKMKYN